MFPILQLPHWVAESLGVLHDREFQEALTYSSVCGYYYTRLIDNLMDHDGGASEEASLLPMAGVLVCEFQFAYQKYFSAEHELWNYFRAIWLAAAENSAGDAGLCDVSPDSFERISSRKFAAAGIPIAATCYFYRRPDAFMLWDVFAHGLGRWSQMFDDILDWHEDRNHGRATWFLSEAERRKSAAESVDQWVVVGPGRAWGFARLNEWMQDLVAQAGVLGSPGARQFLEQRQRLVRAKEEDLTQGYAALAQLASILEAR